MSVYFADKGLYTLLPIKCTCTTAQKPICFDARLMNRYTRMPTHILHLVESGSCMYQRFDH